MEPIGTLLLTAGAIGFALSMFAIGRRKPVRVLSRDFDFSHYKQFENTR